MKATVKIRKWHDMAKEFGFINSNLITIDCDGGFTKDMVPLCGKEIKIEYNEEDEIWIELFTGQEWLITKDMVEPEYRHLMEVPDDN